MNNKGSNDFILKSRTGILINTVNDKKVESKSIEFDSLEKINEYLGLKKKQLILNAKPIPQFAANTILRENNDIISTLENLNLYQWEFSSKHDSINRQIIRRDEKIITNEFNHFSLSVGFQLYEDSPKIELGIGTTENEKINRDGLKTRINDVANNIQSAIDVEFKERLPVILDSGDGGIFFHEVVGHALEADYIAMNISPFGIDDLGKKILPKEITITTIDNKDTFFSKINSDDEGREFNKKPLIYKGVLNKILTDNFYSELLHIENTSSARVEDFTKPSQPRMHSIFLKQGDYDREELIESVKFGVLAKEFGEGKVLFSNNSFSLIVKESYLIENGKVTAPLGPIILKGNILEVLNSIKMIGDNFKYDSGVSYCYKNEQRLNVRVGQPSVKIENIIVSRYW